MKLLVLDTHPSGSHPLQLTVRWLRTLLDSPAVKWEEEQRLAAAQAQREAEELLWGELPDIVEAQAALFRIRAAYARYKEATTFNATVVEMRRLIEEVRLACCAKEG